MLEVIIKRDGTEENFDSRKANKWLLWAGHDLVNRIDWVGIVMRAIENAPTVMSSQDFQLALIKGCLDQSDWPHNLLAGRLYAAYLRKKLFDDVIPSVQELHTKLQGLGLMIDMGYSAAEYNVISTFIDHDRDFDMAHFQLAHDHSKYSISNRTTGQVYETPQFVAMRMAMHICKDVEDAKERLERVKVFYDNYSKGSVSSPSPNYSNLGTHNRGLASCCLIAAGDSAVSLAIANHIVFTMTYKSAGEGLSLGCRSILDEVRGGAISHNGKLPYLSSFGKAVKANKQGSRSGALTVFVSVFDPEIADVIMLQNPRTPLKKQNRDLHVCVMDNFFFAWKVAKREKFFTFNVYTAPDLYHAQFSGDRDLFMQLYDKYEYDDSFKKNYLDAYDIAVMIESQGHEVSTVYNVDIGECNTHTSFKDPILSLNLCVEIGQPTAPYESMKDLYSTEDHGRGEVSLCSLGGIPVPKFPLKKGHDAAYEQACYVAVVTADTCIDLSEYEFPHMEMTAKARRNIAIGMTGIAEYFARRGIRFDTPYGLEVASALAERHLYYVIKASLRLAREKGNAPWIHKTKWPDGWLPLDTYKKSMDEYVPHVLHYDWEALRAEIVEQGGLRNSALVAHMPFESSSKRHAHPNGVYPIRELYLNKTDGANKLDWCAPDGDLIGADYQLAYDIAHMALMIYYGTLQKWADQSISADTYEDRIANPRISKDTLVERYLFRKKLGVKARYYGNSKLPSEGADSVLASQLNELNGVGELLTDMEPSGGICEGGACSC